VPLSSIIRHFESLPDPRHHRNRRHLLGDVITLAVCGVIVGCDGPTAIAAWARAKQDWLREVLELPSGVPSRDCIRRVLSLLKPEAFHAVLNPDCQPGGRDGSRGHGPQRLIAIVANGASVSRAGRGLHPVALGHGNGRRRAAGQEKSTRSPSFPNDRSD
jgi:hypothetical protein